MHRRPQSLLLPECVLWEMGRAGVGEKGILAGNVVGVCAGRERPEGKMPGRWRNAEGGGGGALRSPGGVHCADTLGISLWKELKRF